MFAPGPQREKSFPVAGNPKRSLSTVESRSTGGVEHDSTREPDRQVPYCEFLTLAEDRAKGPAPMSVGTVGNGIAENFQNSVLRFDGSS